MIGARRMAYPRIEAFSLWTFVAGYFVIFLGPVLRGVPDRWTGYAPLQTQAGPGMISYLFGFAVISVGMIAAGLQFGPARSSLPRAGHDLEPGTDLRLVHHRQPPHC